MWNNLKPVETTQKLPEATWNQPFSIFYWKINYFQVEFVLILHPKVFFGQICSQKLNFFKLTEIWYSGTLLYPHFEFNVYFSKIFVIHIFLGKFGLKICSPNWLKFRSYIIYNFYSLLFRTKSDVVPVDRNLAFVYIINITCWL